MLPKTLTIAGFDSSGGAGIQADLKTFCAFNCYGMSVLTALPIQNTCGVTNCYAIPPAAIHEQLESVFADIRPDAIKIGMLFNCEIIELVADFLAKNAKNIPLVIDPVMVAKSGDRLLKMDAIDCLVNKLLPLASVVTPNLDEASVILNRKILSLEDMQVAAQELLALGIKAVLLKGGHLDIGSKNINSNDCQDLLATAEFSRWLSAKRVLTKNTHGTGCTLSAAITARLAYGDDLEQSCLRAKEYLTKALLSFQHETIGHGAGPVNHLVNLS